MIILTQFSVLPPMCKRGIVKGQKSKSPSLWLGLGMCRHTGLQSRCMVATEVDFSPMPSQSGYV